MKTSTVQPPVSRSRSRRQPARAFTLIEMLVVITIISILLAVTIPALRGMNSSGSRKSAVRTMMGVLDQARMMAISDGKATYVVFAGAALKGTSASAMMGRAYAVFEEDANFNPVQRSPWLYLPTGVSFKLSSDYWTVANRIDRSPYPTDPKFGVTSPHAGSNSSPTSATVLPYVKFDSTGAIDSTLANDNTAQDFRVLIYDGSINDSGVEVSTHNVAGVDQNVLLDEIRINPSTGRAKYTLNPVDNLPPSS